MYIHIGLPRYQANNLLLTALVPGPHELSGDDLQHVLKLDVDDQTMLYKEGIVVITPLYPAGDFRAPTSFRSPTILMYMFHKVVESDWHASRAQWTTLRFVDVQGMLTWYLAINV